MMKRNLNDDERLADYRTIVADAVDSLRGKRRQSTNLYLNTAAYEAANWVGPAFQRICAKQRCLVVFVDDRPWANFGHECRYRFYDADSHAFLYEQAARFPPYSDWVPATYTAIHEPIVPANTQQGIALPIENAPSDSSSAGQRYAILFAGAGLRRVLNDLEYCYRMLTDYYGFARANVRVLYFDGGLHLDSPTLSATHWPSETDRDPYRIAIDGPGTRTAFQGECARLASVLQPQDLLLVHTNGHGDTGRTPPQSFLFEHGGGQYFAAEFCADLQVLGPHTSLVVMMQQCCSAGFIAPLIAARRANSIQAQRLALACASAATSFPTSDFKFNCFSQGWIAAQWQADPFGNAVTADFDGSGFVEVREAFRHAKSAATQDRPKQGADPASGGNIRLA